MPAAQPSTHTPAKKKRKKRRRGTRRRVGDKTACLICHREFHKLTATHLRTHGYTLARYHRTFTPESVSQAPLPLPQSDSGPRRELALKVAQEMVEDDAFVASLADEVGELIFSSSLRGKLRAGLMTALAGRLELHGKAMSNLEQVRQELSQPWRVQSGGKDGEPTPTPHLVAMAGELAMELKAAEDAFIKVTKLAIEESRTHQDRLEGLAGRPSFQGDGDPIPVPPELTPGERETVRGLLSVLHAEMQTRADLRQTVVVQGTVVPVQTPATVERAADEHPPLQTPAPPAAAPPAVEDDPFAFD